MDVVTTGYDVPVTKRTTLQVRMAPSYFDRLHAIRLYLTKTRPGQSSDKCGWTFSATVRHLIDRFHESLPPEDQAPT